MTHPLSSMTGFGRSDGSTGGLSWVWELRSVNGRGLDLRFRLPAGLDALEPGLRERAAQALRRGSVTATLAVRREEAAVLVVDEAALEAALRLALALAARIPDCPPPRAEALLALPGVLRSAAAAEAPDPAAAVAQYGADLSRGFATALAALVASRRGEGARLSALLTGQLAEVARLRQQAQAEAAAQPLLQRARIMDSLHALLREAGAPGLSEERLAQEVALLASRSDVREELDRLDSHIQAAHALLAEGAQIGRRFDFLVQEFNREANTLCSKSASAALTTTGLALKALIEQLREQVQNIE
jgi:uncharacterized protein (TIGR00255 family)